MTLHDRRRLSVCAIWNFNLSANNIVVNMLKNPPHIGKSCTVAVPTSGSMSTEAVVVVVVGLSAKSTTIDGCALPNSMFMLDVILISVLVGFSVFLLSFISCVA